MYGAAQKYSSTCALMRGPTSAKPPVQIDLVPSGTGCRQQAAMRWQSRQFVVTPELLGMRSTQECDQRAAKLGLTSLPSLPSRQQHWRLDVLLAWSQANGLDRLPWLGQGAAQRQPFRCVAPFHTRVKPYTRSPLPAIEGTTERLHGA
jgi:hypothetical protein